MKISDRYPLTKETEAQVALACATEPRFWSAIGISLDSERLPTPSARLIIDAVRAINKTTPCSKVMFVIQNLRTMVNAGKLTLAEVKAASDLLDAAEDAGGLGDLEGLVASVADAIRNVANKAALAAALDRHGKSDNAAAESAEEFAKVAALGTKSASVGHRATYSTMEVVDAATTMLRDPLATGIAELDLALGGGVERGSLNAVLGGTGDGKSMFLCSVAAEAIWRGLSVAYVTLEISEDAVKQRVYSNLLGLSADQIKADHREVSRRLGLAKDTFGGFWPVEMPPKATTVSDIASWLRSTEKENFRADLLVVDYGDLLVSKVGKEQRAYEDQGSVYEALYSLNRIRDGYVWTAIQKKRSDARKKKTDLDDAADSMNKVRLADNVIAITRSDDDKRDGFVRFSLPKRRNAVAHGDVGPLTMDAERGRMVVTSRTEPW